MTDVATRCAHCEAPIVDTGTQVLHGSQLFCCANCSQAMEQTTGGSDPQGRQQENEIRCERCTSPIVDDSTMVQEGDRIFCCRNCAAAARGG
jgi:DNA-directed RNA polymerase subunit RPC12/RpoP